jgi:hypothetical protein
MNRHLQFFVIATLVVSFCATHRLAAHDVADIASQDLLVGKDKNKRYFLIEPPKSVKAPKKGFGLIVLLPGGPGGADFHIFVKRMYKYGIPEGYVVAQPVAVKWTEQQEIVWPCLPSPSSAR